MVVQGSEIGKSEMEESEVEGIEVVIWDILRGYGGCLEY